MQAYFLNFEVMFSLNLCCLLTKTVFVIQNKQLMEQLFPFCLVLKFFSRYLNWYAFSLRLINFAGDIIQESRAKTSY